VVPSVVSRELTGEVSRRGSERTKPLRTVRTVPGDIIYVMTPGRCISLSICMVGATSCASRMGE